MAAQVGDAVLYIPDPCHAFDRDASGAFTYSFGRKERDGKTTQISDEEVTKILRQSKRVPRLATTLVPIGPKTTWAAEVTEVNEDGTVALKIEHALGGVTLNYPKVAGDPTKKIPGTWHKGD